MRVNVRLFVEDRLTRVVLEKILQQMDRDYSIIRFVYWDKNTIQRKVPDLNHSAKENLLYLVVTDQDTPDNCPAGAIENLGAPLSPNLLYRFAVMEIEAWVLADRENFAEYFSVSIRSVSQLPDEISKPKEALVAMVRKSSSKNIRDSFIPNRAKPISSAGLNYNDILSDFVKQRWNVDNAQKYSPSLRRTYQRLQNYRLPDA
ncbi:MAG: hypothetical protein ISN29_07155 [Gammaproteobacteria bacterium AqS3]|nr:hypothetical protein [Gammaproteobacteria bacterium AqS3]